MVKHKSKHSCKNTIYFNLDSETIKDNCKFTFYYNNTDITPTILDVGNEIILANCPSDKYFICTINNDKPIKIPNHPYVSVNRDVLCNFGIEAENHFLFGIIGCMSRCEFKISYAFQSKYSKSKYSPVLLDQFPNLTETPEFPIIKNKITFDTSPTYILKYI